MNDLIFFKSFPSIIEAELFKNILKSENIGSIIKDSGLKFSGDLGDVYGANLFVWEKDLKKTKEILKREKIE
ncbi:MAG: DUF2007 domain-containing protein [Patescibacteria group bacterium]|nr:DUF2007 domain-containing protein [Patescibacteria group bacterium]